ncbi:MAG: dephospho-CoA kinase [Planctomycetota bacterium]
MLQIALTGNVASGKSTVAALLEAEGVPVLRADEVAREVVAPGTPGLARVVDAFGEEVLAPDGGLDRAAMRAVVFADDDARARLESILHPLIRARRDEWIDGLRRRREALAVCEIPLLYETGLEVEFDGVVLVDVSPAERLRRMVDDRGLATFEAERIMAAQLDPAAKRQRADYVIDNDGSLDDLRAAALALLARLRTRAGDPADEG